MKTVNKRITRISKLKIRNKPLTFRIRYVFATMSLLDYMTILFITQILGYTYARFPHHDFSKTTKRITIKLQKVQKWYIRSVLL